jgi:hypothetical protein
MMMIRMMISTSCVWCAELIYLSRRRAEKSDGEKMHVSRLIRQTACLPSIEVEVSTAACVPCMQTHQPLPPLPQQERTGTHPPPATRNTRAL